MRTFRTITPPPAVRAPSPATRPHLRGLDAEVRRHARHLAPRPDARRRGAAAVLTAVAVAAASNAVLALALDRLPGVRDPLYADKATKLRACIAAKPGAGVVVQFGSSRTSNALRGLEMEPLLERHTGRPAVAFNFGVPAAGPVVEGVYLRRWLDEGHPTDLVLLELFPAQMAAQMPQPMESHFANPERFTADEVEWLVARGFPAERFRGQSRSARAAPVHGYRAHLLGRLLPAWLPWHGRYDSSRGTDATGWMRCIYETATTATRSAGEARARAEYGDLLKTLRLDGPAAAAVRESLQLCRGRGVRAAVVVMPEGTAFRALYPPDARRRVAHFIAGLEGEFGPVVIDARDWLDDAAFLDSHHMLPAGASAFTAKLATRVAPLLGSLDAAE